MYYENVQWTLKKIPQISEEISSPKFVYVHILVPHPPYIFSSTGEYPAYNDPMTFTPQRYVDAVSYIDEQIVTVVRQILENSSSPPVILIQGDHGFSRGVSDNRTSGILNAYFLPGVKYSEHLYPSISPVNSFRLVFNLYFDANMNLLPDEIYRDRREVDPQSGNSPYDFFQYNPNDNCSNEK